MWLVKIMWPVISIMAAAMACWVSNCPTLRIYHGGKHPIKQEFFLFVFFFTMIFSVFLWYCRIKCCTGFVRESGLSPIFNGLWMGKCFELHTVSEVFYQHGLLLPTLERLCVNVRSSICLWTCLLLFRSDLLAHRWSSFSALPYQNFSTHTVTGMGMYIFVLYIYLFCQRLARICGECLWNLEIWFAEEKSPWRMSNHKVFKISTYNCNGINNHTYAKIKDMFDYLRQQKCYIHFYKKKKRT